MNYVSQVNSFRRDKTEALKQYVNANPIQSLIYSIAMKFFALYCKNIFIPFSGYLCVILLTASFAIDIAAGCQFSLYKENLLKSINEKKQGLWNDLSSKWNDCVQAVVITPFGGIGKTIKSLFS